LDIFFILFFNRVALVTLQTLEKPTSFTLIMQLLLPEMQMSPTTMLIDKLDRFSSNQFPIDFPIV